MACHHDWPPASGQPNEAPYRSLAYVPFTHVPPAALQPRLLIIDRTGRARNREDCNASAPGCVLLKRFVAVGKIVTARQINQVRPTPSRLNGIAPLNDAVAKNDAWPQIFPWPDRSVHLKPETLAAQGAGAVDPGMAAARPAFRSLGRLHTSWLRARCIGVCASAKGRRTRARIGDDFRRRGDNEALRAAIRPGQIRLVRIEMPSTPIWTVTENAEAA